LHEIKRDYQHILVAWSSGIVFACVVTGREIESGEGIGWKFLIEIVKERHVMIGLFLYCLTRNKRTVRDDRTRRSLKAGSNFQESFNWNDRNSFKKTEIRVADDL
jgi:hypothetical protein